jgi:hypothetical protein
MSASAFAAADTAVFATFGVTALYKVGNAGAGVSVTVIRETPTVDATGFGAPVRAGAQFLSVRVAEVATPVKGDTFTIGAEVLTVQGAPALDGQGTMWRLEC